MLFELDLILEKAIDTYGTAYIFDCIYKKDEKQNKIRDLLNLYWSKYQKNTNDKELIGELMNEIILLASHFKDESFSEEKEKRIVVKLGQHQFDKIKFREGRFSITPYIELTAPKDSLKKICIGPTINKELSRRAIELFLDNNLYYGCVLVGGFDLEYSKTLYRSW